MRTTNLNGKRYNVFSPDEFFSSPKDDQDKFFDLNGAKTRYGNRSRQKKKTSSDNSNKK